MFQGVRDRRDMESHNRRSFAALLCYDVSKQPLLRELIFQSDFAAPDVAEETSKANHLYGNWLLSRKHCCQGRQCTVYVGVLQFRIQVSLDLIKPVLPKILHV